MGPIDSPVMRDSVHLGGCNPLIDKHPHYHEGHKHTWQGVKYLIPNVPATDARQVGTSSGIVPFHNGTKASVVVAQLIATHHRIFRCLFEMQPSLLCKDLD